MGRHSQPNVAMERCRRPIGRAHSRVAVECQAEQAHPRTRNWPRDQAQDLASGGGYT